MDRRPINWERLWLVAAFLIALGAIGAEAFGLSGYVPRRLREQH